MQARQTSQGFSVGKDIGIVGIILERKEVYQEGKDFLYSQEEASVPKLSWYTSE